MCALRLSHKGALITQWVDMSRVTKTTNYYNFLLSDLSKSEKDLPELVTFPANRGILIGGAEQA